MDKEGVLGVMAVDEQGMALHSVGKVPEATAGAVAAIAMHGKALSGADSVVTIESPQGKVLLSRCEGGTVALFMEPKV